MLNKPKRPLYYSAKKQNKSLLKISIATFIIFVFFVILGILTFITYQSKLNKLNRENVLGEFDGICGRIDVDSDNRLGIIDLANIVKSLNASCDDNEYIWGCRSIDVNNDNTINGTDLTNLLGRYETSSCLLGNQFYASPSGSAGGDGSIENPWDLQTAFNKTTTVLPGDTLWLRGGRYGAGGSTLFTIQLDGTATSPITIKGYPNEKAIVDGGIDTPTTSAHIWYWDFEVTNSYPDRVQDISSSERQYGINGLSAGMHVINMVINNTGHPSIGFWDPIKNNGRVYGTVEWGAGVYDYFQDFNGGERGAFIYGQNTGTNGSRLIENNIAFSNFTTGLSTHGDQGRVEKFTYRYNSVFNNNQADTIIYSTTYGAKDILLENNYYYKGGGGIDFGQFGDQYNAIVRNNIFYSSIYVRKWDNFQFTNNDIISTDLLFRKEDYINNLSATNNRFYIGGNSLLKVDNTNYRKFSELKNNLVGNENVYSKNLNVQNKIFIRPNKYAHGKGNITVYNFENKVFESVNLENVLSYGDKYIIRDALDYHRPIISGTYTGGNISLPLHLYEYEPLVGTITHYTHQHTAPEYLNFMVEKVSEDEYFEKVKVPIINKLSYLTNEQVTLSSETSGASIYYTLNGSEPTTSSTLYTSPFDLPQSKVTVKTFAVKDGMQNSPKTNYSLYKVDVNSSNSQLMGKFSFEDSNPSVFINTGPDITGKMPSGVNNGATQVPGVVGNALSFNGTTSFVNFGSYNQLTAFSISFLAKVDPAENRGYPVANASVASNGRNYLIDLRATTNSIISTTDFSDSTRVGINSSDCNDLTEWNHYTITYDGTEMILYCNSVLKVKDAVDGINTINTTGRALVFGRYGSYAAGDYYLGLLDEVYIYNRAINQEEVKAIYSQYQELL